VDIKALGLKDHWVNKGICEDDGEWQQDLIELKELRELKNLHITGYFCDGHVDKQEFIDSVNHLVDPEDGDYRAEDVAWREYTLDEDGSLQFGSGQPITILEL